MTSKTLSMPSQCSFYKKSYSLTHGECLCLMHFHWYPLQLRQEANVWYTDKKYDTYYTFHCFLKRETDHTKLKKNTFCCCLPGGCLTQETNILLANLFSSQVVLLESLRYVVHAVCPVANATLHPPHGPSCSSFINSCCEILSLYH